MAPWFYLNPPFHITLEEAHSYSPQAEIYLTLASLASYSVLAWQLGFPAFAWRQRWRPVLLGGAALAWLVCVFFLPLPLFGPIMVVSCLGFVSSEDWRRWGSLLARLPIPGRLCAAISGTPPTLTAGGGKSVGKGFAATVGKRS